MVHSPSALVGRFCLTFVLLAATGALAADTTRAGP